LRKLLSAIRGIRVLSSIASVRDVFSDAYRDRGTSEGEVQVKADQRLYAVQYADTCLHICRSGSRYSLCPPLGLQETVEPHVH